MKYNTRLQRNLSFRKIVKHKNKTRKTNTNKRLKHKNKRHTIRFVKKQEKYKKNTRKILYGGTDDLDAAVWIIMCIIGGFYAIGKALYCMAFQDYANCDHVDYRALLDIPKTTFEIASLMFGGGGSNFMSKIYDLFKKNKEESMIFCVFMLLQRLKKLKSQNESTNNKHILRLFTENEHYANYANTISEEYMMRLIEAAKFDDFKRIIREAVEQSPSKGNLDADQHNFLDSVTLLSTAVIKQDKKPTKLLGNYILRGKNNSVLSRYFSAIRIRSKVSFSSFHLLKLMRLLAIGNTKILKPVLAFTNIQNIEGEETKGKNIEEELKDLDEVAQENIKAEQEFLIEQQVLLDPGSINLEIQDNFDEQLVKNKEDIDLIISKAVRNAIDNAVMKTTGNMPTTSSSPNVE
jgi:hypothetical protein